MKGFGERALLEQRGQQARHLDRPAGSQRRASNA